MLKLFKKEKKNNKGFTLVELVVVVAILAILVGLLAPQYTKYVERSRKAADAANLDNLVKATQVALADNTYSELIPITPDGKVTVTITITPDKTTAIANPADRQTNIEKALTEYCGNNWDKTTLKSKSWDKKQIMAVLTIDSKASVTVEYTPADLKNKEGADA